MQDHALCLGLELAEVDEEFVCVVANVEVVRVARQGSARWTTLLPLTIHVSTPCAVRSMTTPHAWNRRPHPRIRIQPHTLIARRSRHTGPLECALRMRRVHAKHGPYHGQRVSNMLFSWNGSRW